MGSSSPRIGVKILKKNEKTTTHFCSVYLEHLTPHTQDAIVAPGKYGAFGWDFPLENVMSSYVILTVQLFPWSNKLE